MPASAFALKVLIIALGVLGQALALVRTSFMADALYLYYTNISNVLAILLMGVLLWHLFRHDALPLPAWLQAARFIISAGILLTFVVFSLLLSGRMERAYLLSMNNILVHNLVPLLTCLDYVLFPHIPGDGRARVWHGVVLPILYFAFSILLTLAGVRFEGAAAPYFFLDFKANGWFTLGGGGLGVFWWFLIILALQLGLSFALKALQGRVLRRRQVVTAR